MRSRIVWTASALSATVLTACGSSGNGAPTATTLKLGTPTYVTITMPPPSTTTPPDPNSVVTNEQEHIVQPGEYLLGIARTYCVQGQQIADYNGWVEGIERPLQPGDLIKIPPLACPPGGTASTLPTTTTPPTVPVTTTTFNPAVGGAYTVVSGDTLSGIAARIGTTVEAIVEVNAWKDGAKHVIYEGLVIEIPPVG